MLVREHHEILGLLQAGVERGAKTLLKLVGLLAELRAGFRQRLNGEDEQLDLFGVVHRRTHSRAREVLRGDDHRLDVHAAEEAALAPGGEVFDGLGEDRASGRHDREVAHPLGREVLERRGEHVGLARAGGAVDHALKRWSLTLGVEVVVRAPRDRFERFAVGQAQVEGRGDRLDAILVNRAHHASIGASRASCAAVTLPFEPGDGDADRGVQRA